MKTEAERIAALEDAVTTMAWWLVAAQAGFGERDAKGIVDILQAAPKQDGEEPEAAKGTVI